MDVGELAIQLERVDQRSKSNSHRLDELERDHQALNRLVTAVEVMATKQEGMGKSLDTLVGKVEALEAEPAKKWRFVVEKAIYIVVAAVVGYALAHMGLQ